MQIKIICLLFCLIFFDSCTKQETTSAGNNTDNLQHPDSSYLPVIFLCGQSNMEGVSVDSLLPEIFKQTISNASVFYKPTNNSVNNANIEALQYGVNNNWRSPKIYFGPETGLAYYLTQNGHKVAIVKYAYGGSKLSQIGNPDSNGYWQVNSNATLAHYQILINDWAKPSIAAFKQAGYKPYIAAFVWCQGETDAHESSAAKVYEKNLTDLLNSFKRDLYATDSFVNNMRVIITRTRNVYPYSDMIRQAQGDIAKTYHNAYLIDGDNWPVGKDNIHYTAESEAELHGKSIAAILDRVIP